METMTQETQNLALIEASLAQKRPFGDWCYIDEYTWACYDRRLERLAEHLPVAKILLAALRQASTDSRYRVMGDPVVRSTINTALLGQTELDIANASSEELEAVFSVAARYLIEGRQVSPLEAGAQQAIRIGSNSYHAWVWCEERAEDAFGQSFRRLLNQADSRYVLCTPDDHAQKMLVQGSQLLSELLPKLARSALHHNHIVAMLEVADQKQRNNKRPGSSTLYSFSNSIIPGTIFLFSSVLQTPWQAAENLFHEALHQKLYDIEHTHSIFRRGYRVANSPQIRSLWNRSSSND